MRLEIDIWLGRHSLEIYLSKDYCRVLFPLSNVREFGARLRFWF